MPVITLRPKPVTSKALHLLRSCEVGNQEVSWKTQQQINAYFCQSWVKLRSFSKKQIIQHAYLILYRHEMEQSFLHVIDGVISKYWINRQGTC